MRSMKVMMTLFLMSFSLIAAAGETTITTNEDLQFIRDWVKAEKAAEVADVLNLTADQVATLQDIKAATEEVKAEYAPRFEEHRQALEETAAAVRERIESTGTFSEEDRALMKNLKVERRAIRAEQRNSLQAATAGLKDLLTEEQIEALKAYRDANREERGEALADRNRGERANRDRGNRSARKQKQRLGRLLLSDSFLAQFN